MILMVLAVFHPLHRILNPQAALFVTAILALLATVIGFCAFKTATGKVAGIGGLTLFCAVGVFLSYTTISPDESKGVEQPQPIVGPAQP